MKSKDDKEAKENVVFAIGIIRNEVLFDIKK